MAIKGIAFISAIEPNQTDIAVSFIGDAMIAAMIIAFRCHIFILLKVLLPFAGLIKRPLDVYLAEFQYRAPYVITQGQIYAHRQIAILFAIGK